MRRALNRRRARSRGSAFTCGIVLGGLQCGGCAASDPAPFYERMLALGVYQKEGNGLTRQPFLSEPTVMDSLAWIAGDWDQQDVIEPTANLPGSKKAEAPQTWTIDRAAMTVSAGSLGGGGRPTAIVSWDPYARRWVSTLPPPYTYGVMTAKAWGNGRLDLVGPVSFPGGEFVMRHSLPPLAGSV